MPYTPDPLDTTQPTEDKLVESAAAEFRALKTRIAQVAAAAQSGSQAVGGVIIPNQVMTNATVNGRLEFPSTNPLDWNTVASSMMVQFEFVTTNYFSQNPNGHFAIVARCDTSQIATKVLGQGAAIGNLTGAQEGTSVNPGAQVETFFADLLAVGTRYLVPKAATAKPLLDNTRYRVVVESVRTQAGYNKTRLAISRANITRSAFDMELDTGYVNIDNVAIDMSKSGFVIGHVAASGSTWQISFENIAIIWGPAPTEAESNIDRLSRFGGTVDGNLTINGTTTTNGLTYFNGATSPVGSNLTTGLYNLAGAQSSAFWYAGQDMENLSSSGGVSSALGLAGDFSAVNANIEYATRPLYAYISFLIGILREKKVI